jgi:hypothetical protein
MIPIKKYEGDFKTMIRLKFSTGNTLFYSQPFNGSIDKNQFAKEKGAVRGILYRGPANYLD